MAATRHPSWTSSGGGAFLPHADALHTLAAHFNRDICDVRLLRLRLRFGSPHHVTCGVAFRVAVDLVDEMAQPPPSAVAAAVAAAAVDIQIKLLVVYSDGSDGLVLQVARSSSGSSACQWRFDCVIADTSATTTSTSTPPVVRLEICSSSASQSTPTTPLTASHALLQSLCVGSQWMISTSQPPPHPQSHVLILPVVSDMIQVISQPQPGQSSPAPTPASYSSLCLRTFAVPSLEPTAPTAMRHLQIEEDYGEAMGSHIWDASIWLSLAWIASSTSHLNSASADVLPLLSMLELGAGCGLFAAVFAQLARHQSQPFRMILTEKGHSVARIQANLQRNSSNEEPTKENAVRVCELLWGTSVDGVLDCDTVDVDVVFAADVLYHWSAHEELLKTLEGLIPSHLCSTPVVIIHKHRGHATTMRLETVLRDGVDTQCPDCGFDQWHVQRLARIANVDVLQLTRHTK